jgi:biopolymer transport protein ExbB
MFSSFNWMDAITTSPISLVLVVCSVVTLGAALERLHYYAKRRGNPDDIFRRAVFRLREGKLREAELVCENTTHPVGPVGLEVLRGADTPSETFEERLHVALSVQRLLLERNLGILGTMAAVAPLIGLLGTVWGIMRAFSDMAQTGSAAPSVVAAGVAEALITTAIGLIIAVPALMIYNHLSRRMNVMLTIAENHGRSLRTLMVEQGAHREALGEAAHRQARANIQARAASEQPEPEPEFTR